MTSNLTGLTSAEVAQLVRAGRVNRPPRTELRDYTQIVARNLFTWFNVMVTPAAVALFALGQVQGGIAVSGMAIVNTALSLFQEIRGKMHLDKLAILVEARARVLRDGVEQTIAAGDMVQGDTVLIDSGATIVADGPVLLANFLEIDEALLTGESEPVRRQAGDRLLSGSFCVAGNGAYRADMVGAAAFANDTSAKARHYHFVASPMTRIINRLVQILSYTALALVVIYSVMYIAGDFPKTHAQRVEFVQMIAATLTSLVPQGMVLTATVSFTLGAIYMGRRGAIVQRLNAVEAMASIDVICSDKTGTLTTNRLRLEKLHVLAAELGEDEVRRRLRLFAWASIDSQNKNIQALRQALGDLDGTHAQPLSQGERGVIDQIPFKSQQRYSAVKLHDDATARALVLGAFETLQTRLALKAQSDLGKLVHELQRSGLRTLLFCEIDPGDWPGLQSSATPPGSPLALVCMGDELRPEAGKVLEALYAQGISFKILSGDNPETVRATVRHIDLPLARDPVVSGDELANAADADELIRSRSVFGRIAPEQKAAIVASLKKQGFNVAMIGDGVNDVLPIKRADLGIAMGEGSQASKTVAGMILETNDFCLLPETLEEGRTIVRNLRRSSKLFLVKNVYSFLLIVAYAIGLFHVPFPYVPQQVTLLNWLVIGIPAFVIALSRERATTTARPHFLREVGSFALRTGILFALAGVAILLIAGWLHGPDVPTQRTMLLAVLILLGVTALLRALKDGEQGKIAGDTRFRLLAVLAIPAFLLAAYVPRAAKFFAFVPLEVVDWLAIGGVASVTYLLTMVSDYGRILLHMRPDSKPASRAP